MKTLWRKNQENSTDRISHAWAPLKNHSDDFCNKLSADPDYHHCQCPIIYNIRLELTVPIMQVGIYGMEGLYRYIF
jgi:hypothetical protein